MRSKAFYTSIYNICLCLIEIESKRGKEEARAKSAKKTGSPSEASLRLGGVDRGHKTGLGFA